MAIKISLCMIVKNEENNLDNCLMSVHEIMDEIIIVDTGSTDKTIDIASKYTDKIYHFDWIDDFSAARNYSFSKATEEYIMWLDADDIMLQEDRFKFIDLKEKLDNSIDIVFMPYVTVIDVNNNPLLVSTRERIVRRACNFKWMGRIHEHIEGDGKSYLSDINITHTDMDQDASIDRNLKILEKIVQVEKDDELKYVYYYGISLFRKKEHDKALVEFNKFIEANKTVGHPGLDVYVCAHKIYLMREDYENAYLVLANNEKMFSEKSEFYTHLGNFSRDILKDDEMACSYYKRATKCTGVDPGKKIFIQRYEEYYYYLPYYYMGRCLINLKKFEEAKFSLTQALKYKPNNVTIKEIIVRLNKLIELSEKL